MPRPPAARRLLAGLTVGISVAALLTATPTPPAQAAPATTALAPTNTTFAADDYCLGECGDILPPGQNGNATLVEVLGNQAFGTLPKHSADQLGRYADLVYSYAGLRQDQISSFFNDASFGVPPGQVERDYSPRADVRIVRDKATGVPHITGTTRGGTMYGAGYAGAEDRLFTMDLLRHVGRGTLTPFAGGHPGNRALEQSVWRTSPYTEADLRAQIEALRVKSGARGEQLYADVQEYIAGINAYIRTCMANRNCPGEYVLAGHLDSVTNAGGPKPFQMTDLIAIAGVVGGLFGGGGGTEMQSALVRIAARARYGTVEGDKVWTAFRHQNDPETVLTLHDGQSFPYGAASPDAPSVVLPDAGSARVEPVVTDRLTAAVAAGAPAVVLASGDPGLFGIVRRLRAAGLPVRVLPAVSSVAAAFARAGLDWDGAAVVTAHGRDLRPALNACRALPAVAVLTAPGAGAAEIGAGMAGWPRVLVVAEHLGTDAERVTWTTAEAAAGRVWADPHVLLSLAPAAADGLAPAGGAAPQESTAVTAEAGSAGGNHRPGVGPMRTDNQPAAAPAGGWALPESAYAHRDSMITKAEVRALVVARLRPRLGRLVWDVGAGSGSVGIECALLGAAVVAVERDPAAPVAANAARHGVHLRVVTGDAPAALHGLPDPDAVFVGGGGTDVLAAVTARRPDRVVVTLAALDRVAPAVHLLRAAGYAVSGSQLAAARLADLPGGSVRLAATNPVVVLTGERP